MGLTAITAHAAVLLYPYQLAFCLTVSASLLAILVGLPLRWPCTLNRRCWLSARGNTTKQGASVTGFSSLTLGCSDTCSGAWLWD